MLAVFDFCLKLSDFCSNISDFFQKKSHQGVYEVVPIEQWHFSPSNKGDNCSTKEVSRNTEGLSLEEQIRPWKENPTWIDRSPDVKVEISSTYPNTYNLSLKVDVGLPPEAVHDILTDPGKGYFNTTECKTWVTSQKVLSEGLRQVIDVEEAKTIWGFLWWSKTTSNHVLVDQNKGDFTMKFKLKEPEYCMQRHEGCWKMEPIFIDQHLCFPFKPTSVMNYVSRTKGKGRIGSRLTLQKFVRHPWDSEQRDMTARDEKIMVDCVFGKAAKIRDELPSSGTCIKERWALRRKIARHNHRKLSSI